MDIQGYINWLIAHWYIFVIVILGALCLGLYSKLQKSKKQYYSEIKEHDEVMKREFKLNPSSLKWLTKKGKKIGKINGMVKKIKTIREKVRMIDEKGVAKIEEKIMPVTFYKFDVSPNNYIFFWTGHEKVTLKESYLKFDYENSRVTVRNDIDLEYYRDYFTEPDEESKVITDMEFYRTLRDKDIDGVGYQAKRYSEVMNEWGHDARMKELEIEKLKEEKKLAGTKAR